MFELYQVRKLFRTSINIIMSVIWAKIWIINISSGLLFSSFLAGCEFIDATYRF